MSNLKMAVELVKAAKDLYDSTETFHEYRDAIGRAHRGKEPFLPPKEAQNVLKKNAEIIHWLRIISKEGFLEPEVPKVGLNDLQNGSSNQQSIEKLREGLKIREEHLEWLEEKVRKMDEIIYDAEILSGVARDISHDFDKLLRAAIPDYGSVGKVNYFLFSQTFSKIGGSHSTIARLARDTKKRLEKDVKAYRTGTVNLKSNLASFFNSGAEDYNHKI